MSRYLLDVERTASEQYESDYSFIREALAPQYEHLSNREIEQLLHSQFGKAISPADLEFSLRDFGKAVGPVAGAVLPVAGTVIGGTFGGPVGAALGGALGSAAGDVIGNATRPASPSPPPPASRPATPPRPAPPPSAPAMAAPPRPTPSVMPVAPVPASPRRAAPAAMPAAQPIVSAGNPAAQLIGALFTPQMIQALLALLLGRVGQRSVPVGSTEVPVGAFANLLSVLANQAAIEYNASTYNAGEDVPRYLMDAYGEFVVDPAVPEQRAAVLLEMLRQVNVQPTAPARSIDRVHPRATQMSLEDMYDAIELAELYEELEDFEEIEDFEDTEWED